MDELQTHIYEFGIFRIDAAKRLLIRGEDETVPLMPKAFETLLYLVEHHGKVNAKDELMSAIWADTSVEENNLTQNISILRRALGEKHGENRFIVTIPGRGYKFVAEVRKINAAQQSEQTAAASGSNQVPNSKFQVPNLTEFQVSDSKVQISKERNEAQKPETRDHTTNRYRFVALAVFIVLALSLIGFYLWRGKAKFDGEALKSIAILPFKPLVAENRNEALEMGMADTLINKISSSGEIIVRPLGSVRQYNALEQDSVLAGRELNVDSVFEGNIQTSGERVRISARLIRTADGKQLWTGNFDEKITDIFVMQDSISERVMAALTLELKGDEQKRLTKHHTENVEAYQLYMKGSFHASKLVLPEAKKGVEYFQQAIAIDPNYALPYVGLSRAYLSFSLSGDIPADEAMPRAKAAALRAVELDETLADSHVAVGWTAFWYDWDWGEVEKRCQRALALDPNNAAAQFLYAHLNSNLGRHEEAIKMGRRARELDPLSLITNSAEGQFHFFAGRSDEALSRLQKTLELDPNFWHAHLVLSMVYTEKGAFAEAVAEADKAAKVSGGNSQAVATKGYGLAKSGKPAEARGVLTELQTSSTARYVAPYNIALIYNALGDTDAALGYLEKAFAEKNVLMVFLKVEPKWNNLRSDSRFISLLKRMRLE
jgi:DNA-binding winged helix-turn-helix (wHTH) protein/TolB-like protein/tetratricopeptide (TPR) repeat protein